MKIRLVIPICDSRKIINVFYCEDSFPEHISFRKSLLCKAMLHDSEDVQLIVTSNNFFTFSPNQLLSGKQFIECYLIPEIMDIRGKKPLIIGVDLYNDRIKFNPYNGIDSLVAFLEVKDGRFVYATHIWECWGGQRRCDSSGFIEQNKNRVIRPFKDNYPICLLSCGDILAICHDSGKSLPPVGEREKFIYLDLAHMGFKKWIIQDKKKGIDRTNLQRWKGDEHIVIVTMQIPEERLKDKNFIGEDQKYLLIWPLSIRENQKLTKIDCCLKVTDDIHKAICLLIDVCI